MKWAAFGPVAPRYGWAPSPNYLLRRDRIRRTIGDARKGELLEIGCGAGALLTELAKQGFECSALETSSKARSIAECLAKQEAVKLDIRENPADDWDARFSIVMAFEVLEHIKYDEQALYLWGSWLAPDGLLLLSVPAHRSKWGAGDVWAGHYRRYEREELTSLLQRTGFEVQRLEVWGFPLANILLPLANIFYAKRLKLREQDADISHATAASGIDRKIQLKFRWLLVNPITAGLFQVLFWLQNAAARSNLGVGYFIVAKMAPPCASAGN